jgi:hypothetical protein
VPPKTEISKGASMKKWLLVAFLAGVLPISCSAPVQQASPGSVRAEPTESCDDKAKAANRAGVTEGVAQGRRDEREAEAKDLLAQGGKIPIQIMVEDIPGRDSYQLAAAEVLKTYFSNHYIVADNARLVIYVSGTPPIDGVLSYDVALQADFDVNVTNGDKLSSVHGQFVLSGQGGTLRVSSESDRTQVVKAAIYSVLSKGDALLYPSA